MQKYMEIIASDSTMRKDMMSLMIGKCKGNKNGMLDMCQTINKSPEMNNMMRKMLNNDESSKMGSKSDENIKKQMIMESTKTIKKPKYDAKLK